ncbi:MAG: DUF2191 domain-containing protein [Thermoanaerobaculia bacterium]
MKTTVDLTDSLLADAKKAAVKRGTTLRELIEEGLSRVLKGDGSGRAFRLRKASFKGKGLASGMKAASWDEIRDLAYKGRGA